MQGLLQHIRQITIAMCCCTIAPAWAGQPSVGSINQNDILRTYLADNEVSELVQMARTNYASLKALNKSGNRKAQGALLRIALGEIGDFYSVSAAAHFLTTLTNKCDARVLLVSSNAQVLDSALLAIRGCPLDRPLSSQLETLTLFDSARVRGLACETLAAATPDGNRDALATLIVNSMKTTLQVADAKKPIGTTDYGCNMSWFRGDLILTDQVRTLGMMQGISAAWLRQCSQDVEGIVRDYLMVSRGFAKDEQVKPELQRILKESDNARLRLSAAESFRVVANREDVPFMEEIARSDPYAAQVAQFIPKDAVMINDEWHLYPVREVMKRTLKEVLSRP